LTQSEWPRRDMLKHPRAVPRETVALEDDRTRGKVFHDLVKKGSGGSEGSEGRAGKEGSGGGDGRWQYRSDSFREVVRKGA
jgi:hypothetical protein